MNKTVTITSKNHKYATTYGGTICKCDFNTEYYNDRNVTNRIVSSFKFDEKCRKNIITRERGKKR